MSGMVVSEQAYINSAINSARGAMNNALAQAKRDAGRYGVDPSSGKAQALNRSALYENAALTASNANDASMNWLQAAQKQDQFDDEMALKWQSEMDQTQLAQDKLNWEKQMYNDNLRKEKAMARSFVNEVKNNDGTQTNSVNPSVKNSSTATPMYNSLGQKRKTRTNVNGMSLHASNEDAYGNTYNTKTGKMKYKSVF